MAVAFLLPFVASAESTPKSEPDVVIYEGEYPGWPWIAKAVDGTLYCVLREGTIHGYSPSGRVMLAKSTDNGGSWSEAKVIYDLPEVDDRNTAIVELPNKDLLVCFNAYTADEVSLAMVMRSSDGGKSWSEPSPTGTANTRTRSAPIVLGNGNLLLPYYLAPGNASLAGISEDNGKSWVTVEITNTNGFVGDEWDVLEVEPNRLIGIHRNNHSESDGTFWKSESRDGGRTWDVPVPTNVQSKRADSPPHITRQNGVPTLIYADRRMVSVSAVTTSDPQFILWDLKNRIPCYRYNSDESPIPDGSYPSSVQVAPSTRLIVDYEIRDASKRIAGYFVEFPRDWGKPR
jgi:Neuraminidase (sialidase)